MKDPRYIGKILIRQLWKLCIEIHQDSFFHGKSVKHVIFHLGWFVKVIL